MRKKTVIWVISLIILTNMLIMLNIPKASSFTWVEGEINVDTTWTIADSPYVISKPVTVTKNATLTIDPGVEIRFGGDFSITVYGNLSAVGTEVNKIIFTSNKASPEKGDWDTIKFVGGENHSFVMEHCIVKYAKKGITCKYSNPGSKLGEKGTDNKYKSHIATKEDIEAMKSTIGVQDQNKNYNIIIDGHGTGLAPPTEEEWNEMIGKVRIVDSVSASRFPDSVDLSQEPYFPPVGDQGSQRSCASWATAYYTNGYLQAKDNDWTDASTGNTQHLISPSWVYNKVEYFPDSDSGSTFPGNYNLMISVGSATLSTMPYDDSDYISWGSEDAWREAPLYRLQNYEYVFLDETDVIKSLVNDGYTVNFAIDAGQYSNGFADGNYIISSEEYSSTTLNHAQTIVGYDDGVTDDGDTGAFKVVNSWGADWGDNGFYWITYEAIKEIWWYPGFRAVDKLDYDPSLLGVWEFNPPCSRNAPVTLGVEAYGIPWTRSPIWNGGSHNFPSFMCLDISEYEGILPGADAFFLEIGFASTSGVISSFKVEHYIGGYVPGNPSEILGEATDVPKTTPCYVTISGPIPSRGSVYIENCELINNGEEGLSIAGNYNLTIANTTVLDNNGYGIYLDSDNNAHISNNLIQKNGKDGIFLSDDWNINIFGNSILRNEKNGIYIGGSYTGNISIKNNIIDENKEEGIYVYGYGAHDVYYKNGTLEYSYGEGSCGIQNIVISNNKISYNGNGIYIHSRNHEFVKVETAIDYAWPSFQRWGSSFIRNTTISDNNTISFNANHGIFMYSYGYAYAESSVSGTLVLGSAKSISYSCISDTTILNNNIFSNGEEGLYIYSDSFSCSYGNASNEWGDSSASAESYSAISNSVISGNTIDGVYFYSNSYSNGYSNAYGYRCYSYVFADSFSNISDSVISDNMVSSNEGNGIYIQGNGFSSSYSYGDGTYAYYDENGVLHTEDCSWGYTFSHATGEISTPGLFNNTVCDNVNNGIYIYGYGSGDTVEEKNSYGNRDDFIVYTAGYAKFYYIKIRNSTISRNGDSGIKISMNGKNKDGTPAFIAYYSEITNNTISYHDNYGVYYSGIKNNSAHFNNIIENGFAAEPVHGRGMWIDTSSYPNPNEEIVNAEQNFWGGYEGPYHSTAVGPYHVSLNPNAIGNAVNGNGVDLDFILPLTGPVIWLYIRPNASISIDKIIAGDKTTEIVGVNKTAVGLNESVVFNASKSKAASDFIIFTTVNEGNISRISITFPSDFDISGAELVSHSSTIGDGTISVDNNNLTVIYNVTNPQIVAASTEIWIMLSNIKNNETSSYNVDIETSDSTGARIDSLTGKKRSLNVAEYRFDYGDGEITKWVTTWVVVHKYSSPGNYTVNLKVKDEYGLESNNTASVNVTVKNNEAAVLLSGTVSPSNGNGTTVFYYNVTYMDNKEGNKPNTTRVYIEGVHIDDEGRQHNVTYAGNMTYISGSNSTGALYSYGTTLPRGEYKYYFVFVVNFGDWNSTTRLPISSYSSYYKGPAVSVNYPPVANFTFSFFPPPPKPLTIASTIRFWDNSSDRDGYIDIISWLWNFGDGTTSTAQNPMHKYTSAGTYTVTLTVTDNGGATNSCQTNITVENACPTATNSSISPLSPNTTDDLIADYTYSDIDGNEEYGTEIRWYKDDVLQSEYNDTLTIPSTATARGQVWYFTVKPKDGIAFGRLNQSLNVTIKNSAPTVTNLTISPPFPFTINDLTANYIYYDIDEDEENGTEIRWYKNGELQSEFNDTTVIPSSATNKMDVWYFTVRPKDGTDFGNLMESSNITISNIQPVANFTYSPKKPTTMDVVEFTDNSSDADGYIASWYWDLGDGNFSNERKPMHQYMTPGHKYVNLTVTDENGANNSFTKRITVSRKTIPLPPEEKINWLPYIVCVLIVVIVVVIGIGLPRARRGLLRVLRGLFRALRGLLRALRPKKKKIEKVMPEKPAMRLRCKRCNEIFSIEIKEKPFTFKCPKCGTEGIMK